MSDNIHVSSSYLLSKLQESVKSLKLQYHAVSTSYGEIFICSKSKNCTLPDSFPKFKIFGSYDTKIWKVSSALAKVSFSIKNQHIQVDVSCRHENLKQAQQIFEPFKRDLEQDTIATVHATVRYILDESVDTTEVRYTSVVEPMFPFVAFFVSLSSFIGFLGFILVFHNCLLASDETHVAVSTLWAIVFVAAVSAVASHLYRYHLHKKAKKSFEAERTSS